MNLLPWATNQRSELHRPDKQPFCGFVQRWCRICRLPLVIWEHLRFLPLPLFLEKKKAKHFPLEFWWSWTLRCSLTYRYPPHKALCLCLLDIRLMSSGRKGTIEEVGRIFSFATKRVYFLLPRRRFRKTVPINYQFQAGNSSFFKWLLSSL